jgi:trigger factor
MSGYKIKITEIPKSQIKIEVEIDADIFDGSRARALKKLSSVMDISGFRKGHIPEKIVLEKAGETLILEETADLVLNEHYPNIIIEEKLETIGRPEISITKIAFGNPFHFSATVAVLPKFDLPKYKSLNKKVGNETLNFEATDKEIEEVLLQIRKNKAHFDWHKANPNEKNHDSHPDFDKVENLPALDDALAVSVGNFQSLEEMKDKVKVNVIESKKMKALEKKRAELMEELLKQTKIEIPDILIESELDKSIAQMKDDVAKAGADFDEYLKHIKKTEEDLRKDLRASSEDKAKIQLIFNKIAEVEKLEPNKEILEKEIKNILELYPDAKEESARIYVSTMLLNQEVLKLLEQ